MGYLWYIQPDIILVKRGGILNIEICSRESIEQISSKGFEPGTALISIGDTGAGMPNMKYEPSRKLCLNFDDISSDETDDYVGRKFALFNEETADRIAKFILSHEKEIKTLICQCEHGQSRSAAVAAAVNEFYFRNGISIFADDRYYPNKLVFRLTLKALFENKQGDI